MSEPTYPRSPIIKIELQLRPTVPDDAEPYWWGNHRLTFRKHGRPVWEADIPEAAWSTGRCAYVRHEPGFGWVLVLTLMHDKAREVLGRLALPDHAGSPDAPREKRPGYGHASSWSFWSHDDVEHEDRALSDDIDDAENGC